MTPALLRTWGLRGVTLRLTVHARSHEKVSGIGALVVSPRRRRIRLYWALRPQENIRGPHVPAFLHHLRRDHPGPLLLLWDRGRPHRHRAVNRYLDTDRYVGWFLSLGGAGGAPDRDWLLKVTGRPALVRQTVRGVLGRVGREEALLRVVRRAAGNCASC